MRLFLLGWFNRSDELRSPSFAFHRGKAKEGEPLR